MLFRRQVFFNFKETEIYVLLTNDKREKQKFLKKKVKKRYNYFVKNREIENQQCKFFFFF